MVREGPHPALRRLRRICAGLSDTAEGVAWGHPNFKTAGKTFAVFEKYKGEWAIAFRAELEQQRFLIAADDRFYATPYVGKHGWVSMKLSGRVDWTALERFVVAAHRLASAHEPPRRPSRGRARRVRS